MAGACRGALIGALVGSLFIRSHRFVFYQHRILFRSQRPLDGQGVQRVLMLVDVVFPGWVPFAYLAESQNIPGWLAAPAQALGYPFQTFIGGHLTRLGTRDDVTIPQQYIADLKAAAANAIDTFDISTGYAAVYDTNPWAICRGYLDGVAAEAAG